MHPEGGGLKDKEYSGNPVKNSKNIKLKTKKKVLLTNIFLIVKKISERGDPPPKKAFTMMNAGVGLTWQKEKKEGGTLLLG